MPRPTRRRAVAATLALAIVSIGSLAAAELSAAAPLGSAPASSGDLLFSTFSICAVDRETGESGVAVTTRVPFVGRAVPWAGAAVGAVATQSWTVVEYGRQGLELLAAGLPPQEAIERLLDGDAGRELRQIGLVDMAGRAAAFTGAENGAWAGSRQGEGYTVQGNLLVGPQVVDAVADRFEATAGLGMPLAERLILALAAGQAAGGDRRKGRLQSAALRIADPDDPGRGGDHLSVVIDVGEHPEPIAEMERIYRTTRQRLGYRAFSEVRGPDVVELKRMLHALGYWRPELAAIPEPPELAADPARLRTDPEAYRAEIGELRRRADAWEEEWGVYDREAIRAVDAFRAEHGLAFEGNPPGLVDEAVIAALREAYERALREKAGSGAEP